MEEYGMILIVWLSDGALIINAVGTSCDNILLVIHDILGNFIDIQVLACEKTRGA